MNGDQCKMQHLSLLCKGLLMSQHTRCRVNPPSVCHVSGRFTARVRDVSLVDERKLSVGKLSPTYAKYDCGPTRCESDQSIVVTIVRYGDRLFSEQETRRLVTAQYIAQVEQTPPLQESND